MSARMSPSAEVEHAAEAVGTEQRLRARDHGIDVGVLVARRLVGRQVRRRRRAAGRTQRAPRALARSLSRDRVAGSRRGSRCSGNGKCSPQALEVAQPDARREDLHLPAGVVDVVLALHREAGGVEQVRERGAEGGVSAVADVQRAGRVRRDELDDHAPACAAAALRP